MMIPSSGGPTPTWPAQPREIVGYGEHPPLIRWAADAKVAVQLVVNYEEGSEKTYAMGDNTNDGLYELPFAVEGQRDLAVESMYEYGVAGRHLAAVPDIRQRRRSGHLLRLGGSARAQSRRRGQARRRGDEAAGHGYRWSNHFEMTREQEREAIKLAIASIEETTGSRPVGWYCREMSTNTRELVVEEGGFEYDSDCYNDDLPYWTTILAALPPRRAVLACR